LPRSHNRPAGTDVFFGFYPVRQHTVTIAGDKHSVYDLMGKPASSLRKGLRYCGAARRYARIDSKQNAADFSRPERARCPGGRTRCLNALGVPRLAVERFTRNDPAPAARSAA
jgi:hypothetical protein